MKYLSLLLLLMLPSPIWAEDRFWILWERFRHVGQDCPNGPGCIVKREFASRPLTPEYPANIYRMFGVMNPRSSALPVEAEHPDAPAVCTTQQTQLAVGFDPLELPRSLKIEALRGIEAIHVDLTNLKSPPGFSNSFGSEIHRDFVAMLTKAGIHVVDKDTIATVPGHPTMSLFFSMRDPDGHCLYEYSVFASLSQEVMLARDIRIKITAGVWSFSTGSTAKDHRGDERSAILRVAEAFIRDHRQVNPR